MVIGIVGVMLLNSCVEEKDMTPDCGKWEVEINNPEATVNIENGLLIIDIPIQNLLGLFIMDQGII